MEVDTGYRSSVTAIDVVRSRVETSLGRSPIIPVGLVDRAFFGSNPKCGSLIVGKVEACDGDFVCFVVRWDGECKGFLFECQWLSDRLSVFDPPEAERAYRRPSCRPDHLYCLISGCWRFACQQSSSSKLGTCDQRPIKAFSRLVNASRECPTAALDQSMTRQR